MTSDALGAYGAVGRSDWLDVPWPEHLRWVGVQGRLMNVVDVGEGPPLLLVHGLSGCWQNWLENIPFLARDHRVIAVDLPGFGESEMPVATISMSGYARSLDALLDALDVDAVRVVGNSMGGFIGCELALAVPARVERLVLVSAAGLSLETIRTRRRAGLRHRAENAAFVYVGWLASKTEAVTRRARLHDVLLLLVAAHPARLPPPLVRELLKGSGKPGFIPALDAMLQYPLRDRLAELACPTFIVWGDKDRLVPVKDADEFERLIDDSRKVIYVDTGHTPMLERPARFNADVHAFLQEGAGEHEPARDRPGARGRTMTLLRGSPRGLGGRAEVARGVGGDRAAVAEACGLKLLARQALEARARQRGVVGGGVRPERGDVGRRVAGEQHAALLPQQRDVAGLVAGRLEHAQRADHRPLDERLVHLHGLDAPWQRSLDVGNHELAQRRRGLRSLLLAAVAHERRRVRRHVHLGTAAAGERGGVARVVGVGVGQDDPADVLGLQVGGRQRFDQRIGATGRTGVDQRGHVGPDDVGMHDCAREQQLDDAGNDLFGHLNALPDGLPTQTQPGAAAGPARAGGRTVSRRDRAAGARHSAGSSAPALSGLAGSRTAAAIAPAETLRG